MFEKRFSFAQVALIVLAVCAIAVIAVGSVAYARYGTLSSESIMSAVGVRKALARPVLTTITIDCYQNKPRVTLDWTQVENATSYVLSRQSPGNAGWPQIGSQTSTTFIDTTFATTGVYNYQVQATASDKRPGYSDIRSVRISSCSQTGSTPTTPTTQNPNPQATTSSPTKPQAATTTKPTNPPVVTQPTTTPPVTPSQAFQKKEWGVYNGWQETALSSFETLVGAKANYQAVFVHWGNESEFPTYLANLKAQGKTLVIFWEALDYNVTSVNQPKFSYDAISSGKWDSYLTQFAADAKAYGGPVILIPFSEMNGDWFATGGTVNGNNALKFVAAWKHVHSFFRGSSNVKFGFAPNNDSSPNTPENQPERYYPGNEYVDYVGIDGFNDGKPWLTFDQIFGSMIRRMDVYHKPLFIFSFAAKEDTRKAAWITDALTVQIPKYPSIKGWIWFNENKEKDWRVNSDAAALAAFKAAVQ